VSITINVWLVNLIYIIGGTNSFKNHLRRVMIERWLKLVQSILKPIMLRRTKFSIDRESRGVISHILYPLFGCLICSKILVCLQANYHSSSSWYSDYLLWTHIVKEYSSPTRGGAKFALQVGFRTPEMIGPWTMTLVAGSLQYLWNQSNQVREDMGRLHGALCLTGVKETYST